MEITFNRIYDSVTNQTQSHDYIFSIARLCYNKCAIGGINMCTITATELKTNFGKYMILGQKEKINVTHRGKIIFTIVPKETILLDKLEKMFGSMPREAYLDKDIDRE